MSSFQAAGAEFLSSSEKKIAALRARAEARNNAPGGGKTTSMGEIVSDLGQRVSSLECTLKQTIEDLAQLKVDTKKMVQECASDAAESRDRLTQRIKKFEDSVSLSLDNMQKKVNVAKGQNTILDEQTRQIKIEMGQMREQLDLLTNEVIGDS